jgi:Sap, sulfolipid-1-addressing protein
VDPQKTADMMDRMGKLASSPVIAIVGAGAALANPGAFIPIALKDISETDPSATEYIVNWIFFSLASLLPLALALLLLLVAREWTMRVLHSVRDWLQLHAMTVAAVLIALLALSLLRNGISGLTS